MKHGEEGREKIVQQKKGEEKSNNKKDEAVRFCAMIWELRESDRGDLRNFRNLKTKKSKKQKVSSFLLKLFLSQFFNFPIGSDFYQCHPF